METKKSKYGMIGMAIGGLAFLLALVHFWAGPLSPKPTLETVVAEKVSSIRNAALDALKGKEPVRVQQAAHWDKDKMVEVATVFLGGVAFILGLIGYAVKESSRVTGGAAILGISAIAFQFLAMYAMALLVVLLIGLVLSSLNVDIGIG
ncbi:hypothetical protein [Marinobacterium marinum]|uniref:Inner membrane protein yidI n=1 Tax=Marinobacterium marinum TaxID=2756129 RepID=A0A7W1WZX6_9GAMM|nr:hypothetical protein [Marinobacterium marinum]MBA4503297.1 hypothetical protein [Marinobacterium marinum]